MAKYKRTNLGVKDKDIPVCSTTSKNKIRYPSFYVRKKLPLDKKSIGKSFDVKAKIKFTGLSQNSSQRNDEFSYDFDIIDIEF